MIFVLVIELINFIFDAANNDEQDFELSNMYVMWKYIKIELSRTWCAELFKRMFIDKCTELASKCSSQHLVLRARC